MHSSEGQLELLDLLAKFGGQRNDRDVIYGRDRLEALNHWILQFSAQQHIHLTLNCQSTAFYFRVAISDAFLYDGTLGFFRLVRDVSDHEFGEHVSARGTHGGLQCNHKALSLSGCQ